MRISRFSAFTFPVPFKVVFRHASASRDHAENLIVAAHAEDGRVGYGEGCPRHYVTGETVPGGLAFIRSHADSLVADVRDVGSLRAWIAEHRDAIDRNPAAFCAMEIAMLDLFGQASGECIEELVGLSRPSSPLRYSAVLGNAPYPAYRWQLRRYRKRGFSDFKVKLSGNPARDRRKMLALAGIAARIRLGIGTIVGCQVGETSILTRAALPVMQCAGADLVAAEGAFGTQLLQRDLTTPSLMFGEGGLLDTGAMPRAPGLGLTVSHKELKPLGDW